MVKDQIYIDRSAVDMPTEQVQLSIRSNILGKVDELTTSFSYTIKLPRTLTNDKIMRQGWSVTSTSRYFYDWRNCEYYIDGLKIFDGRLVVLEVDDEFYNCNLVWGFNGLKTIKDEGKKLWELCELTDDHYNDYVYLNQNTLNERNFFIGRDVYGFAKYDSGIRIDIAERFNLPTLLPCVTARYILARIYDKYKLQLDLPDYANNMIDNLIIPLTSRYSYRKDKPVITWDLQKNYAPTTGEWSYEWVCTYNGRGMVDKMVVSPMMEYWYTTHVDSTLTNVHIKMHSRQPFYINLPALNGGRNIPSTQQVGEYWYIDYYEDDVNIKQGDRLDWGISINGDTPPHSWIQFIYLDTYTFEIAPVRNEMSANSGYPIMPNLPDISCLEFLTELFSICALSPISMTEDKVLKCINMEELKNNTMTIGVIGIKSLEFHENGYARNNVLQWATDDAQSDDYSARIIFDDYTLKDNGTWFESHFAMVSGANTIRMYDTKTKDDETEVETLDLTDRIALLDASETATLTRTGLEWQELLVNYHTLTSVLARPKKIKATARLTTAQLQKLDISRAIYVEQYASYFAVLAVETGDDDIYDVELLKI